MPTKCELCSIAWLLMGMTGSTPGVLELANDRLSFVACGAGALTKGQSMALAQAVNTPGAAESLLNGEDVQIFDVPLREIGQVDFPWYYFGGGMVLHIGNTSFRFSFAQPQNTQLPVERSKNLKKAIEQLSAIGANISNARATGRAWKTALA